MNENKFLKEDLEYCDQQIRDAESMIAASQSPYSKIAVDAWTKYRDRWKRIKEALEK